MRDKSEGRCRGEEGKTPVTAACLEGRMSLLLSAVMSLAGEQK